VKKGKKEEKKKAKKAKEGAKEEVKKGKKEEKKKAKKEKEDEEEEKRKGEEEEKKEKEKEKAEEEEARKAEEAQRKEEEQEEGEKDREEEEKEAEEEKEEREEEKRKVNNSKNKTKEKEDEEEEKRQGEEEDKKEQAKQKVEEEEARKAEEAQRAEEEQEEAEKDREEEEKEAEEEKEEREEENRKVNKAQNKSKEKPKPAPVKKKEVAPVRPINNSNGNHSGNESRNNKSKPALLQHKHAEDSQLALMFDPVVASASMLDPSAALAIVAANHEAGEPANCATCPGLDALGCPEANPGSTCVINDEGSSCFGPAKFSVKCPHDNTDANKAVDIEGEMPAVLCRVCNIEVGHDRDSRKGFLSVDVTFGPNILDGKVKESVITDYRVYFADSSGRPVGNVLATVPKSLANDANACCHRSAYSVSVKGVKILPNAVSLTVLPTDEKGFLLPVGAQATFVDVPTTTTTTTTTKRPNSVRIAGKLVLWTSKSTAFASDPEVGRAVGESIAQVAGVSPSFVYVFMQAEASLLSASDEVDADVLLAENHGTKEDPEGRVHVSYIINLPSSEAHHKAGVLKGLDAMTPEGLTTIMSRRLAYVVGKDKYSISVTAIGAPSADKTSEASTGTGTQSGARSRSASVTIALLMSLCLALVALFSAFDE